MIEASIRPVSCLVLSECMAAPGLQVNFCASCSPTVCCNISGCVYRKIRFCNIGDAVRQGQVMAPRRSIARCNGASLLVITTGGRTRRVGGCPMLHVRRHHLPDRRGCSRPRGLAARHDRGLPILDEASFAQALAEHLSSRRPPR